MNEVIKNILERHSTRNFKSDMPPKELIEEIVQAGLYAASGMNRQETIIVAITDKKVRDKLSKHNAAIMGWDRDPFYGAPVVLVVLYKKGCPTGIYDGSLVMSNLMLAAHSLGLSSCWIHRAKETFEMPEWKEYLKSIGTEGEYEGVGNCIIGYGVEVRERAERKKGRVFFD